ncbi:MAG: hypothetical protein NZU63_12340 [Gemmataceae bacterium]|nr:hypothetical protein [Gemmataceae bacterium]MDW8241583.1 hypothetical protein [Thermogemmata sp.]
MLDRPISELTPEERLERLGAIIGRGVRRYHPRRRHDPSPCTDGSTNLSETPPVDLDLSKTAVLSVWTVRGLNTETSGDLTMTLHIERELAVLQQMSTGQLCQRYAVLYG